MLLTHIEHKEIILNPRWVSLHQAVGSHQASLGRRGWMLSCGHLPPPPRPRRCSQLLTQSEAPAAVLTPPAFSVAPFLCVDPLHSMGEPQAFFTNSHPQISLKPLGSLCPWHSINVYWGNEWKRDISVTIGLEHQYPNILFSLVSPRHVESYPRLSSVISRH